MSGSVASSRSKRSVSSTSSAVPVRMPAAPATPPDHVFALADASTFTVDDEECIAFIRVPRPQRAGGLRPGTGTIIRLRDVLVHMCGLTAARARDNPREYALEQLLGTKLSMSRDGAEEALSLVRVLVTGLNAKPMIFVFSEVVGALMTAVHKADLLAAVSLQLNVARLVATLEVHNDDDNDIDTSGNAVTAGCRIASWFLSLKNGGRGFLRPIIGAMNAATRDFVHAWLLGLKTELTVSAAELSRRIRDGTKNEAGKARTVLRERAESGFAFIAETLALSPRALHEARERERVEQLARDEFVRAEQAFLAALVGPSDAESSKDAEPAEVPPITDAQRAEAREEGRARAKAFKAEERKRHQRSMSAQNAACSRLQYRVMSRF